jgi:hypothetical protein
MPNVTLCVLLFICHSHSKIIVMEHRVVVASDCYAGVGQYMREMEQYLDCGGSYRKSAYV